MDPRHAVGVTAFCASGAASPLRISPESEGDTEGARLPALHRGFPIGLPPLPRFRVVLEKRPSASKVSLM